MMRQMTRIIPALPAGAYQTYRVLSPPDRTIRAACEQAGCLAWRYGWETPVDETAELGRQQAAYIRRESGRTFTERPAGDGITVFRFEPGQRCFAEHQTRPEIYLVQGGDWRHATGPARRHTRPGDWVEDFGEHQQRLANQRQKG